MPPGFLVVLSEPGANVTVEEFQDWYNYNLSYTTVCQLRLFNREPQTLKFDPVHPVYANQQSQLK